MSLYADELQDLWTGHAHFSERLKRLFDNIRLESSQAESKQVLTDSLTNKALRDGFQQAAQQIIAKRQVSITSRRAMQSVLGMIFQPNEINYGESMQGLRSIDEMETSRRFKAQVLTSDLKETVGREFNELQAELMAQDREARELFKTAWLGVRLAVRLYSR